MSARAAAARRVKDTIARFRGGGPRRIAESAGLVAERGRGSYLYSDSGTPYLDVISGYGVAALGHAHPHWVEAVVEQSRRLVVTPLHTPGLASYLEALAHVLPDTVGRPALFSTGAEAVEMALRLTQTASGRPGVLTFRDGFHGKTAGVRYAGNPGTPEARSLGPRWLRTAAFPLCEAHDALTYARCDESVIAVFDAIAARNDLDDVGTVLVEPVLGTAGNLPPRKPFLSELRRVCTERGWRLVLDESITGFGRTGTLFAFEQFDLEPDVLVLGKGLGGGLPLSAVCASADLWEASAFSAPSATATTFGGNPLACAGGLATLEIVTGEGFLDHVRGVSAHAAAHLVELARASPRVSYPRGIGLMLGFDLVDGRTGELATRDHCAATFRACRDRGVLLLADVPRVRLSPPLTITTEEVDRLFGVLFDVLV